MGQDPVRKCYTIPNFVTLQHLNVDFEQNCEIESLYVSILSGERDHL